MPVLPKPRHEAFARAIVAGLLETTRNNYSQGKAYVAAGYQTTNTNSADAAASRLLRKVKNISDRVRELQAEAAARLERKLDVSRERIGKRLDLASRMAEQADNPAAIVSSELGIAKVFGHITEKHEDVTKPDFAQATSLHDIGCKLLQSVGYAEPSDDDVSLALEAHRAFTEQIEAIAERARATSQ